MHDVGDTDETAQGVQRAVPSVEFLPLTFDGRRVGHLTVEHGGERDEWEMHPDQDELLYLVKGTIDVFFREELDGGEGQDQVMTFGQGEACVIPRGMWHRQVVIGRCRMLFLTPMTVHRPYSPTREWSDEATS